PELKIVQVSANQPMLPGDTTDYTMRLKNEGNTDMQVVLSADSPDGWTAIAQNPDTQSSLVLVPAFDEITFTLQVTSASNSRHGDFHTITVVGQPQSFTTGFSDDFNTESEVDIRVEINEPVMRITNELSNMRTTTMLMLAGFVILIVAAIAGRRRRSEWDEEEEDYEDELDEEFDLPVAVTDIESSEQKDDGEEAEEEDPLDDIELVD
ncbi:MAG TPA: NEW3 domain-containing protein, partial [Candidatus Thalassarchaeaceae archaeon]|nr:NEW3 domain-containing protein [Candidatus Thalassarchaeaceae archaeon]